MKNDFTDFLHYYIISAVIKILSFNDQTYCYDKSIYTHAQNPQKKK